MLRSEDQKHEWRNGRRAGFRLRARGSDVGQRVGSVEDKESTSAPIGTSGPASEAFGPDSIDVVEAALGKALEAATADKRWDVVAQLGRELEARRVARGAPNVVVMSCRGRGRKS
jgi:hypothetical protein